MEGYPPVKSKLKMLKKPGQSCLQIVNSNIAFLSEENTRLTDKILSLNKDLNDFMDSYSALEEKYDALIETNKDNDILRNIKANKQHKYNKKINRHKKR